MDDSRRHSPRFQGENLDRNRALIDRLTAIATAKGITVAQLAIAWSLSRGDDIVPLIGMSNAGRLAQAVEATRVELTDEDLAAIEAAIPLGAAAGERYAPAQMAMLDSER